MYFNKILILIGSLIVAFVFWGGTQLSRPNGILPLENESFLNYVIPRIKTFLPRFSLWGRSFVDTKKLAPKSPQAIAHAVSVPGNSVPQKIPVPTNVPIPIPTENKNQKKSEITKLDTTPTLKVDQLESDKSEKTQEPKDELESDVPVIGVVPPNINGDSPENEVDNWKQKIYDNPSKNTMNDLIHQYELNKVSKPVYYEVLNSLLKDSNHEYQSLAVYALAATPSVESLTALVNNKYLLSNPAQAHSARAIDEYAKPEKLGILKQAIGSGNKNLVLNTLPLVSKIGGQMTLWSQDSLSNESSDRSKRGPTNRVPKGGIMDIMETLKSLEDSNDRQLSQAARDTLVQLNFHSSTAFSRE